MKNKYFTMIVIVVPVIMLFCFEAYIYSIKDKSALINSVISVRESNVNCLIMGDSHTEQSFRGNIKECVNLSVGGATIPMIADAIYSVEKNNDLKLVVIPLDPHNFSEYRLNNYTTMYKDIATQNKLLLTIPILKKIAINKIKSSLREKEIEKGWIDYSSQERQESLDGRLKKHLKIQKFESTNYSKIYKELVKYLINKDIKVYLVRTPVIPEYEKKIFEYIGYDRWKKYVNSFTLIGANYIDYKFLEFNYKNNSMFENQDHLNKEGAKIFSKIFSKNFIDDKHNY